MLDEPEYSAEWEQAHADGVCDGENMKNMHFCLDCFNLVDSMINDMLSEQMK